MKRVVFASGKGGTGKTTVASLVARLAAREMPIALADCDVEAANLPIALGAVVTGCELFAGGAKAVIDAARCRGCGACVPACRFDAIAPSDDFGRSRAFVVDEWACEGCGACVRECSDGVLRMEPAQAGEACRADTAVGPMAFGRLAPGQDLSGKLVTEVRSLADAAAGSVSAELLLIDGPPGVGCPAIASITNTDMLVAVAEPTVSGEHDLMRLVLLARRLGVPVVVALNKADLSEPGAARLRARVLAEGLELVTEIPFDTALGSRVVHGEAAIPASPGMTAVGDVWSYLRGRLE